MNKAIRSILLKSAVIVTIAFLIFLFGLNSNIVMRYYTSGFYQYSSVAQRLISSAFPFAIGDFLYFIFIVYCIWSLYRTIKRWRRKEQGIFISSLLKFINFSLLLYIIFKVLWGLNYSRPSVTTALGISDEKYNTKELVLLAEFLINKLNTVQVELDTKHEKRAFTVKELEAKSAAAYHHLAQKNVFFKYRIPAVKPVVFSWMVTKIGLEGYYNPLSGEANVNMRLPAMVLPFVTCHEISHELSIAREDEANLIGYLVSINSPDLNFQYSGYYNILRNVLFEIRMKAPEDFEKIYKTINAATVADFKTEREFWAAYNGDMAGYMNVALDSFLKINNQAKGVDSYQDIVLWVYNLHRKSLKNEVVAAPH